MKAKPLDCLLQVKEIFANLPNGDNQAMWLCSSVLNLDTAHMLLNDANVSEDAYNRLMETAHKVKNGYPLQYATLSTQFMGLDFMTAPNVLIPRNETEVLVEMAIKHAGDKPMRVLDLCCGSGCIGISLKYYCRNAHVTLGDISEDALNLTAKNAEAIGVKVDIIKTDMFDNLTGAFDLILSNPPYIPTAVIPTLSAQVRHEPSLALDGREDGLHYYRIIKAEYRRFLKPGGVMLLEIGHDQGKSLVSLFGGGQVFKDYQGRDRIIKLEK